MMAKLMYQGSRELAAAETTTTRISKMTVGPPPRSPRRPGTECPEPASPWIQNRALPSVPFRASPNNRSRGAPVRRLCTASSSRTLWYDPFVGRPAGRSDPLEVGVVMQDHQARHLRGRRDDEIRDRQPMLTASSQRVLQLDGP